MAGSIGNWQSEIGNTLRSRAAHEITLDLSMFVVFRVVVDRNNVLIRER